MEGQPDPLSPEYEAMVLERFVLMRELDTKVDLGQLTQAEADQCYAEFVSGQQAGGDV